MSADENDIKMVLTYVETQVPVTDDWYPCFSGNTVVVRLIGYEYKSKVAINEVDERVKFIISVEGAGFFSLAKKFYASDATVGELKDFINNMPKGVSKDWFRKRGFTE